MWFEPPYPVVIAQDPEKRGVNVQITSYPVHYEWQEWEVVGSERHCAWDPDTNVKDDGDKDPNTPGTQTACDLNWEDWSYHDYDRYGCVWHDTWAPDPIDTSSISLVAVLTQNSRQWIAQELALKYPGLDLRHPDWHNLTASWDVSYYDDMTYVASTVINIPVEEPGIYDFSMGGRTSSTPYSGSQSFGFNGDFAVNFLGETLVK